VEISQGGISPKPPIEPKPKPFDVCMSCKRSGLDLIALSCGHLIHSECFKARDVSPNKREYGRCPICKMEIKEITLKKLDETRDGLKFKKVDISEVELAMRNHAQYEGFGRALILVSRNEGSFEESCEIIANHFYRHCVPSEFKN
jgi:hypothetical protein